MFDPAELERAFGLHDRSYRLFLWLNDALRRSAVPYAQMEEVLTRTEAAKAWLESSAASLPADLRPSPAEREAFASHFVSFINTSFEVVDSMLVPRCPGCTCCGFKKIGRRHLKVRSLGRHAKETAEELKAVYLQGLAESLGRALPPADARRFAAENPDLAEELALAAYAQEVLRRASFHSQGEAVLALWREIKEASQDPEESRPWSAARRRKKKKKLQITAARALEAEKALAARLGA